MSVLNTTLLRDAIAEAITSTWAVKIINGQAILHQQIPYANLRLDNVEMEPLSICDVAQRYQWEITYVGKFTSNEVIEDLKVARANELIPELMSSTTFATYGMNPRIASVEFEESDDPQEPFYAVTIMFEFEVHEQRFVTV